MLIRSQDGMVQTEHSSGIWIVLGTKIYWASTNNDNYQIEFADYETTHKAIKVLDMIQQAYENSLYCDHAFDNAAQVQRPYIFMQNTVFQMPQDSGVEV